MSTVTIEPLVGNSLRRSPKLYLNPKITPHFSLNYSRKPLSANVTLRFRRRRSTFALRASSTDAAVIETSEKSDVVLTETFLVKRPERAEGKIAIRLDKGKDEENWHLSVGCSVPGKWILHWGVNYAGDAGSEWDQPPPEMRPSGSITIKDYAIETPLKGSSTILEGEKFQEVKIDISSKWSIAAINFVLKDEETGVWYQHRGRDFKIPLIDYLEDDANIVGVKKGSGIWPGPLGQLSNILLKPEAAPSKGEASSNDGSSLKNKRLEGFYEEQTIVKETFVDNTVSVIVKHCPDTAKNILYIDTDLPGNVVLHWGVCKDDAKTWELPTTPYPAETVVFKNKALRTLLQRKEGGDGSSGLFTLDGGLSGFVFVVKLDENTWLNCKGNDFYIPLSSGKYQSSTIHSEERKQDEESNSSEILNRAPEEKQAGSMFTDEIIKEIRNLVTGISSEKSRKTKSKETQENILQEIEKLAAEAYSIFRSSTPTVPTISENVVSEAEVSQPDVKVSSGTGSGFEILCQGFNWESHKSGRWYRELHEKAAELSSLGFSVIWLPPPTDSVSPEGYMPRDLYNLNSRYGSFDELKVTVKKFHEVGIKVLGDVVLNHRCASERNQNGIWNIFGGRLNWDDRAVVADDPHFQGRGNKSSGDNFHAAPNIDHSQEFVRKDIKEWLHWLREEIGYDGWRLDFVRGFWGGYVKDYLDATEPYFAVGEYWDSLSYTYGEMDHNQDAHRQRIVDWINATNGTAGAFDVTTKGILHSAIERCEYWRLSDQKGKPPGVVGWWPSRAVTFIENHDTGSTQGHWRFPGGKEMQGYAYILTHPGTPSVFFDHIFSGYRSEIGTLMSLRRRNKINCRSMVKITKAERDVYAAVIDDKLTVKIGPGHYEPPSGDQRWSLAAEGNNYKVWESS
ncbi:alpha-amylase 3, chloroplastic isoform X2 [Nicotiana tabacum]|uniref:alpha-amylase n=2 Tax=Nicotiana TaxID=4085 RepID=A0A1S3YVN1_TOBAC|nr:PREDICTED: alpha-amylase 3, chloroplastic isoform X2 [Nicotiana sylvestris]XP_016456173.1 PREDICTED: alpha-amylase 3, chloroplastic-like isoform X2 [Nicotiana tabacum]